MLVQEWRIFRTLITLWMEEESPCQAVEERSEKKSCNGLEREENFCGFLFLQFILFCGEDKSAT